MKSKAHLTDCVDHYKTTRKDLDHLAIGKAGTTPLHPEFVTKVLNELASEDAIFTVDVGTPSIWAARYLHFNGDRRMLGSWSHGSMAGALPQAIGAQAVYPKRQVVVMAGDGGLAMLMGELLTAVQNKLPVKIVVYNNSALAFVEVEMMSPALSLLEQNSRILTSARLQKPAVCSAGVSLNLKNLALLCLMPSPTKVRP